jgi:hypothetical protein
MADSLRAAGHNAQLEVICGDNRADVLLTDSKGRRLAIELQHTNISIDEIERRAGTYAQSGIAQLWIPFLRGGSVVGAISQGSLIVERYPARPFEKWVHGFGMGSMWLYDADTQGLYRGVLKPHVIEVEAKVWPIGGRFECGELVTEYDSSGGYSYNSRRWRELHLEGPFQTHELRVTVSQRRAFAASGYSWPAAAVGNFWHDNQARGT